jgi:flagellar export protein FliJ
MKPFHFTLEPLRSLRKHKEDEARERYAQTVRACEEAAARVQAASVELTACWKTLCETLAAGVTGDDLLRARAWCNVLELRVKERANALEQARLAVDAVWKELLVATRERETLDKFHDKRRRAYERQLQREEQKNLDELAIQLTRHALPLRTASAAQTATLAEPGAFAP